jgi:hypothetical protein
MRPVHRILPVLAAVGLSLWVATVSAQQVTVGTPFHSLNNSFFENMGVNWSLQGQGWSASFGTPGMAQPPFGGFNAGAGLSFGFGILNQGVTGKFNFNFSSGDSRSNVSSTPMVTLQNGVPGYFSDTTQSPFVISDIPIVGNPAVAQALQRARAQRAAMDDDDQALGLSAAQAAVQAQADPGPPPLPQAGPRPRAQAAAGAVAVARPQHDVLLAGRPDAAAASEAASRVARATQSSAGRAVPSVAEARRLYEAHQHDETADGEIAEYLARAQNAENLGKPAVARQYYRLALRHAGDSQRGEIQSRLEALTASSSGRTEEK